MDLAIVVVSLFGVIMNSITTVDSLGGVSVFRVLGSLRIVRSTL